MKDALRRNIQNLGVCPPFNSFETACYSIEKAYNYQMKKDKTINLVGRYRDIKQLELTWWGDSKEG